MAQKVTEKHMAGAECLIYEYAGFRRALGVHKQLRQPMFDGNLSADTRRVLLNLSLESALIHARNVLYFFKVKDHGDDVRVCHFVTERVPDFDMEYLKGRSQELNKLLGHPSYHRGKLDRNWDLVRLESEITTAWETFLRCLSQENPELRALFPTA